MEQNNFLREHLIKLMRGGQVSRTQQELLEGMTVEEAGRKIENVPYTIWQLLDHLRFAQHDILDFSRNPDYQEPAWPDDYWPAETSPKDEAHLQQTLDTLCTDLNEMIQLVQDPANDLFKPFPHGTGQTLLREAMLIAEHNAYHLGQIVLLRRLLKK